MCILCQNIIFSDPASYFLEMIMLIILGLSSAPDSIKNRDGLHRISWYGAQDGSICLPSVKIQNFVHV